MAFSFVQLSKTLGNWTVGQINDSLKEQSEHIFVRNNASYHCFYFSRIKKNAYCLGVGKILSFPF